MQCPVAYEVALNNVSMRNALVKSGVPFVNLPGNVFLPFMGIVLQDVYRKQLVKAEDVYKRQEKANLWQSGIRKTIKNHLGRGDGSRRGSRG